MFSCFTKVFQTHNIVVDPEFQAALHESSKLVKEQQKMIGAFIEKIGGLHENISGLKMEMEKLRRENAEMREKMVDLSGKISTVIVEVFEEMESEAKEAKKDDDSLLPSAPFQGAKKVEPKKSPCPSPYPATPLEVPNEPLEIVKVTPIKPIEITKVKETTVEEVVTEEEAPKEEYQELPEEVAEEELEASPEPVPEPEPVVTKKGRGGGRSKKK